MSYDFKKIIDLELLTEVPEGANVLIEADGATKRLPSTAIKTDDYYSKEESDAKYLTKENAPNQVQVDYNDNDASSPAHILNRPFSSELITWDGVIGDREYFSLGDRNIVKVSDRVFTIEELVGSVVTFMEYGEKYEFVIPIPDDIMEMNGLLILGEGFVWIVPEDNFDLNAVAPTMLEAEGSTEPMILSKGTYFMIQESSGRSAMPEDVIPFYVSSLEAIKKLDKKFLHAPLTITLTYNNCFSESTDFGESGLGNGYRYQYTDDDTKIKEALLENEEVWIDFSDVLSGQPCRSKVIGYNIGDYLTMYCMTQDQYGIPCFALIWCAQNTAN